MAWFYVLAAGALEIIWPLGLKYSHNWWMWTGTIILIVISFYLLIKAYETLPAGTVYAVFTGMGTSGIFLIDTFIMGRDVSWQTICFFLLIVSGVIGLKLITEDEPEENPPNVLPKNTSSDNSFGGVK